MSQITDDPSDVPLPPPVPHTELRKIGGVIIPSRTWVPFLAGAVGGMAGAVLTAPLDVVKTRLQSDFYRERVAASRAAVPARGGLEVWRHLTETAIILRYYIS
jgi:solute carrier family 25 protein 33/36